MMCSRRLAMVLFTFVTIFAPAVSALALECDFFKIEGGYLESSGYLGGNLKCSGYPSVEAAKKECLSMIGCDGFSFGPWGSGQGGCLKENRNGGFNANPKYVGYHKTLMGCCGGDTLTNGQCRHREGKFEEKLVSRGKPATQSSIYSGGGAASRCVDGNKNQQWASKSCCLTTKSFNPWWAVDLLQTYDVTKVVITSRDCCLEYLSNFVISVGDSPFHEANPACLIGGTFAKAETKEFPCPLRGRFLTVTLVSPAQYLGMCEVEVYAMVPPEEEL